MVLLLKDLYVHVWESTYGKCLVDKDGCFGCGNKGHKMRDPKLTEKGREVKQASPNDPDHNAALKNHSYVLQDNKDK